MKRERPRRPRLSTCCRISATCVSWFAAVAERIDPPKGIGDDEPWVHVDLSEQTLVLYQGKTPTYATLVSSGIDDHRTPEGEFAIRRKFISDTMADLGPEAGDDRYRIEDVPWTQYFAGLSRLTRRILARTLWTAALSHGCVNLSPADARHVFEHTWPALPRGWHGVSTEQTGFKASRVIVNPIRRNKHMREKRTAVCFVCLGNICRSPTAEAVFIDLLQRRNLLEQFVVDSAGTGEWHVGHRADARAIEAAARRGIPIKSIARQFAPSDFEQFDYVVAMDRSNRSDLLRLASDDAGISKVHLLRNFDPNSPPESDVPDPYLEGGFDAVFDICQAACEAFLEHITAKP